MPPWRKLIAPALAPLFPLLAWAGWRQPSELSANSHFHLAVGHLLASAHALHLDTFPQLDELHWEQYFPDHDFLFHALASLAIRIGGETAALWLTPLAVGGAALATYWIALLALAPLEAAACAAASFFALPWIAPLYEFGPRALSVALLLFLLGAALHRRPLVAGLAALACGLAGPALYPSLFGGGLAAVIAAREKSWRAAEVLAAVLFGLLCATLVNPYFPTNAEWGGGEWLPAYGFPLTIALLPFAIAMLPGRAAVLALCAAVQLTFFFLPARGIANTGDRLRAGIARIPAGPAKVYNCETDFGSHLIYARPDLRVVDAFNSRELLEVEPGHWLAREQLGSGVITDLRAGVNGLFKAGYVLCAKGPSEDLFDADPSFEKLGDGLFRVAAAPLPQFARSLEFRIRDESWQAWDHFDSVSALSFRDWRKPGENCARVRVPASEAARFSGARFLGLGGGGSIVATRNGRQIFRNVGEFPKAASLHTLVPLTPPLRASDHVEAVVCSLPSRAYWSVAISFWGAEICARSPSLCGKQDHEAKQE